MGPLHSAKVLQKQRLVPWDFPMLPLGRAYLPQKEGENENGWALSVKPLARLDSS